MPSPIQALASYRVNLIPKQMPAEDVEAANNVGALPWVGVRATSCDDARRRARASLVGVIHSVDRQEEQAEPAALAA